MLLAGAGANRLVCRQYHLLRSTRHNTHLGVASPPLHQALVETLHEDNNGPYQHLNGHSVAREAAAAVQEPTHPAEALQVSTSLAPEQQQAQQQPLQQQVQDAEPAAQPQPEKKKKGGSLVKRVISGIVLGAAAAAIVLLGNVPFLTAVIIITFQATREYYGFITSKAMTKGMAPPPPLVSISTAVLCTSIALAAYMTKGRSGTVLAAASFLLLVLQVVTSRRPKFSQLASSLFGLFYCGWMPAFWVKLRGLAAAAPPVPFTGWLASISGWTVGLVATFTTVACVIAADTGAYFVGKALGRTKLTEISPKKTVEGAAGGLASSVAVALGLWRITQWPATPLAAAGLGVLVFFSSLFGDLIESIMKRDAEMKDSGDLIPGHGGLLDRIDSYMFTGAVTYFYCMFILPEFGIVMA